MRLIDRRGPRVIALVVALLSTACVTSSDEGRAGRTTTWGTTGTTGSSAVPPPAPLPFARGTQAVAADAFVDSIGVNVHLHYVGTGYERFDAVRTALADLGVRHVRDYPVPEEAAKFRALARDGVGLTAVMGVAEPKEWFPYGLEELYETVRRDLRGAVVAVEGANEWDVNGGDDWVEDVRDHQARLYELMNSRASTADIPVLAPSLARSNQLDELGDLRAVSDQGNVHAYTGGRPPTAAHITAETERARAVSGDLPLVVTETGYHNATRAPRDHFLGHRPASEEATAVYLPVTYLQNFAAGIHRTFAYELLDERRDPARVEPEMNFGLLRHDFTPKPAFTALGRLIALLADPGPPIRPGRLDHALEGAGDDVATLLLQQRDGTFHLVMWREASVWDPDARQALPAAPTPVTVRLRQPIARAEVHRPSEADASVAVVEAPSAVTVDVGPAAVVLRLVPST